jgi:flagellar hook protein FlgE
MSVFSALFSGVSGLQTFGNALGILSDNITNVNTVGYKESRARFTSLVAESSSVNTYSPGGVGLVPQTLVSKQGLLQASTSPTDLSIDGQGFFVVRAGVSVADPTGEFQFTRAGSFAPNADGFLVNTAGQRLMGWPIDSTGNIPTNLGDLSVLQQINTSGLTGTAEATTQMSLRANLQSSGAVSPAATGAPGTYNPATTGINMASGNVTPDFVRTIQVFDEQGSTHTLAVAFLKSATVNEWYAEIYSDPASDVTSVVGSTTDGQLAVGTVGFNTNGTIDWGTTTASLQAPMAAAWTNGATASNITLDLGNDADSNGFTQFDSISALISSTVDGAVFGNVTGVSISENGVVTALFDNGLSRDVYKLPIATFQNPDGLTRRQGNAYVGSDRSGNFSLVEAGTGGGGGIAPSTLEASTVDLANEFTQLITTQRAFTASSRVITTADEMLDELNRIKR